MSSEPDGNESSEVEQLVKESESPVNREPDAERQTRNTELDTLQSHHSNGRQFRYRRMGVALGLVGLVTYLLSWFYPETRELLLIIGGTGLFTAVMVFYLTPERFVPVSVSERIFEPLLENNRDIVNELGFRGPPVYVPIGEHDGSDGTREVVLFISEHEKSELPGSDVLAERTIIMDSDRRGFAVRPSAISLIRNFTASVSSGLNNNPPQLTAQLTDGLTNSLEFIGSATEEIRQDENRATFRISSPCYSNLDRIDNPIPSFIGTGLAAGLGSPVEVTVRESPEDEVGDWVIDCTWKP